MFHPQELISPKYVVLQRLLHTHADLYGERGDKWADTVLALIAEHQATSVLDYGCGQGSLKLAVMATRPFGLRFDEYDPAIAGKTGLPSFADLVVCTDVLEHIEPDRLDSVLSHIRLLARKTVLVVVALVPTAKVLADGRNAHLIVRPAQWWRNRFTQAGFTILRAPSVARKKKSHELTVVLTP